MLLWTGLTGRQKKLEQNKNSSLYSIETESVLRKKMPIRTLIIKGEDSSCIITETGIQTKDELVTVEKNSNRIELSIKKSKTNSKPKKYRMKIDETLLFDSICLYGRIYLEMSTTVLNKEWFECKVYDDVKFNITTPYLDLNLHSLSISCYDHSVVTCMDIPVDIAKVRTHDFSRLNGLMVSKFVNANAYDKSLINLCKDKFCILKSNRPTN
jgi:hypothetical protein